MTREKSDLGVIFIYLFFALDQAILEAKTVLQELSVLWNNKFHLYFS